MFVGDVSLDPQGQGPDTLRRDRIGFVFQAFNLIPTLTAEENILLPLAIAGRRPDPEWFDDRHRHRRAGRPAQASAERAVGRPAAACGLRSRPPSRPEIVFADEPTGNLDSASGAEVLSFLRRSVDEFGQTIVMVTHDPGAASHTDRVVFLADGRIVDEMREPTADAVLERMKGFEKALGHGQGRRAPAGGCLRCCAPPGSACSLAGSDSS